MRLHILGLPHTQMTADYSWCAFTDRTRTFAAMMAREGWDVRLYAPGVCDVPVTEYVSLATDDERDAWFPDWTPARVFNTFDPQHPGWQAFNARAIAAVTERAAPGDVLCLTMGTSHWPVAQALPRLYHVETGIGYSGVIAPFRVYESHAWRAFLAARQETDDCRFYDTVIPRAWEPEDFPAGAGDGGYALFVGRVMERKGIRIAMDATERAGMRLVVAGQHDGSVDLDRPHVEYVGVVGPEERARLMGGAVALLSPSIYFEPLGGVHLEAQLTGTPVVTTDWGVYPETVRDGVNGWRCSLLRDFTAALEHAPMLDRAAIREQAHTRWTTPVVAPQFTAYLDRLRTLDGAGWYAA